MTTAGEARLAANILVEVWRQQGSDYADYDVVWNAKEYLHDKADEIEGEQTPFGACGCGSTSCAVLRTKHQCWCARCNPGAWWMVTCADCGSKRCPRAMSHKNACARSGDVS